MVGARGVRSVVERHDGAGLTERKVFAPALAPVHVAE
jgi:hypothetical protein